MENRKRYADNDTRFRKQDVVQKFSALPKIYYSRELKGSRFHSKRQPLDPIPVHGTVSFWDEAGFGFITPDVSLSKIDGFAGRVFIHKNDLKFNMEKLEKEDRVTFLLYRDAKGVGAHSCCLMEDEDESEDVDVEPVVSMLIPNKLLPRFIGRKGETIDAISQGCEVTISVHTDKAREQQNELQLVVVKGETEKVTTACQEISSTLTASAASVSKMVFIIPENQTGRFIGHGGIGIKQIVDAEKDVSVSISKHTVNYEGSSFNKIVLFGPQLKMKKTLDALIPKLTHLHANVVKDYLYGKKRTVTNTPNTQKRFPIKRFSKTAERPKMNNDARFKKYNNTE